MCSNLGGNVLPPWEHVLSWWRSIFIMISKWADEGRDKVKTMFCTAVLCLERLLPNGKWCSDARFEIHATSTSCVAHWLMFTLPVICRGVRQTSHIIPPLSIQQWWVPGGARMINIMIGYSCSKVRKCWILNRGDETVEVRVPIAGL